MASFNLPYDNLGGKYDWDDEKKLFTYSRHYGFGSNFLVLSMILFYLKSKNYCPEKIITYLSNYKNLNMFSSLFYIDEKKLKIWKDFPIALVENYLKTQGCNIHPTGFGNNSSDNDFNIIAPLMDAYFNLQPEIYKKAEKIKQEIQFTPESIFVWFRKTDKIIELQTGGPINYPSLNRIKNFINNKKPIYFQTDDKNILKEIEMFEEFKNIKILNFLPPSENNIPSHDFIYTKGSLETAEEHLQNLLALCVVASQSKNFIGYPGSVSNLICLLLRKSFENAVILKHNNDSLNYTNSNYCL